MDEPPHRPPKLPLVIGQTLESSLIDSYPWDKLPRTLNNPNDYDTVLLDFSEGRGKDELARHSVITHLQKDPYARVLTRTGARLIVVGSLGSFVLGLAKIILRSET